MISRFACHIVFTSVVTVLYSMFPLQTTMATDLPSTAISPGTQFIPEVKHSMTPVSRLDGVQFVTGTSSQVLLSKDGKQYLIDTSEQKIFEVTSSPSDNTQESQTQNPVTTARKDPPTANDAENKEKDNKKKEKDTYYTEDIVLWNLPTSHPIEKKALMVNFTHRWAFDRAFADGSASNLFGMDGFSISSFGLTYGLTNRLSVGAYRVPSALARIIQLSFGVQLSREDQGHPFSSRFRVAVEGANHFTRNYDTDLELSFAKSIRRRAQVYFVPTVSLNSRPLGIPFAGAPAVKGETTTALGGGLSIEVRPTVSLIGEIIKRTSGLTDEEGKRPAFMLGIQKKIYRHTFTLGLTNSPGTTLLQRSATRQALGPGFREDSWSGLTLGFNLYRRLF